MTLSPFDTPAPLRLVRPEFARLHLTLVGCGGTGSHLASGLAALAQALDARGVAVEMLFVDPDGVEPKNVGRQLFAPADVGRSKAEVLARRIREAFNVAAYPLARAIEPADTFLEHDALSVVVGAVDNAPARALIAAAVAQARGALWWLDCGNEARSGQVALGNCADGKMLRGAAALGLIDRLPAPHVVYPDLVAKPTHRPALARSASARERGRNGRGPACADLAADQGLMVNRMVAAWALTLLHDFLLGEVRWFALAFDLAWGGTRAYALDAPTLAEASGLTVQKLEAKHA